MPPLPAEATIIVLPTALACRRRWRTAPLRRPLNLLGAVLLASLQVGCALAGPRANLPVRQAAVRPGTPPPRVAPRPAPPAAPAALPRPAAIEPDPAQVAQVEPVVEPVRADGPNRPYRALGRDYLPLTTDVPVVERGQASWYGHRFHGRRTASGEPFDMHAMTAAHPTLPLPSYAVVRNPANGREVVVRVNDRGPFHTTRIIDLSQMAARKLGIGGVGTVEVRRLTNEEIRTGSWRRSPTDPAADDDPRLALRRSDALMASAPDLLPPTAAGASLPVAREDADSAVASLALPPSLAALPSATSPMPLSAMSAMPAAPAASATLVAAAVPELVATHAAGAASPAGMVSAGIDGAAASPPSRTGPTPATAPATDGVAAAVAVPAAVGAGRAAGPSLTASAAGTANLAPMTAAAPAFRAPATSPSPAVPTASMASSTPQVVATSASASALASSPTQMAAATPAAMSAAMAMPMPAQTATATATVTTTATAVPVSAGGPGYWVQLGAFRVREGAESFRHRLAQDLQWLAPVLSVLSDADLHRLLAGPYPSRDQASGVAQRLREALSLVPLVVERR